VVAPGMLQNPSVKTWLADVEPAWTLLDARSVVAEACDLFTWPDFDQVGAFQFHKVINEPDFLPLYFVRNVLQADTHLRKQKGHLKVTPAGRRMMEEPNVSALQALLLRARAAQFAPAGSPGTTQWGVRGLAGHCDELSGSPEYLHQSRTPAREPQPSGVQLEMTPGDLLLAVPEPVPASVHIAKITLSHPMARSHAAAAAGVCSGCWPADSPVMYASTVVATWSAAAMSTASSTCV
jgi:hypothetical protein